MSATVIHPYVVHDQQLLNGEPIIIGTKTPVRAIVEMWRLGMAPEEIPLHLPHLTPAQVFDALSYYADNQAEINHYIEINRIPEHLIHPAVLAIGPLPEPQWGLCTPPDETLTRNNLSS